MMKFNWKTWTGLFVIGTGYIFFIHDNLLAYIHWKTLTKQDIIREASLHIERHKIQQDACLYVVECIDDKAHLRMIKSINTWDIDATKQTVWRRRFKDVCTGTTANIGIYFTSNNQEEWTNIVQHYSGIWSFTSNGFFAQMSRFYGGSFSQFPLENCTPENAIFTDTKP